MFLKKQCNYGQGDPHYCPTEFPSLLPMQPDRTQLVEVSSEDVREFNAMTGCGDDRGSGFEVSTEQIGHTTTASSDNNGQISSDGDALGRLDLSPDENLEPGLYIFGCQGSCHSRFYKRKILCLMFSRRPIGH